MTLTPDQCWALARAWYTGRAEATWRPRTAQETQAVLDDLGLLGDFWRVVDEPR